jgi:hypothetical protein
MGRPGLGFRATDYNHTSPVKENRGIQAIVETPKGEMVQYPVGPRFKYRTEPMNSADTPSRTHYGGAANGKAGHTTLLE